MNQDMFMPEKQHLLINSHICGKYMVFTSHEFSLAEVSESKDSFPGGWGYKTIVWEWDADKNEKKEQIGIPLFSGEAPSQALESHFQICRDLTASEYKETVNKIKKENQKEIDDAEIKKKEIH